MSTSNCEVIVIGGGIAGLAANESLFKNGITNILLVEANNRLGGKTHIINYKYN